MMEKFFKLKQRGTTVGTEIMAGVITFGVHSRGEPDDTCRLGYEQRGGNAGDLSCIVRGYDVHGAYG